MPRMTSRLVDKDGNKHHLSSSVDVKGIKAGDGRKYVLDLFRMSPRDLNWEGDEFDALVFRPKLVETYIYHLKLEASEAIRQRYMAKLTELKQQQHELLVKINADREKQKEEKTNRR
jgi:protein TIF31